jgi:hypothetical protein
MPLISSEAIDAADWEDEGDLPADPSAERERI